MSDDPDQTAGNCGSSESASGQGSVPSRTEEGSGSPGESFQPSSQPLPLPSPSKEWFVAMSGSQHGPFTLQEVVRLITQGQATLADLCWRNGMTNWASAGSIPEIAHSVQQSGIFTRQTFEESMEQARRAAKVGRIAAKDAFFAFLTFIVDPVGGLPTAYKRLGPKGSLSAGIVLGIAYFVLSFLGLRMAEQSMLAGLLSMVEGVWLRIGGTILMPCIFLPLALMGVRKLFPSGEDYQADVFIAGSALVPLGLCIFLASLFIGIWQIGAVLATFAWSYLLLILFTGLTRIYRISEARAALLLPPVLVVAFGITGYLAKLIFSSMIKDAIPF